MEIVDRKISPAGKVPCLVDRETTAVDGFFAPIALRIQTYGPSLDPVAASYPRCLLDKASMRQWYSAGLEEKLPDEPHDAGGDAFE